MRKLRTAIVAAVVLVVSAIAGFPAFAQKPGGTLVQITQPEPPNLAPYISTSAPIGQVTAKIYDGLLEYGFDLKPKPSLAESWQISPDGKTVAFKLRKDVKFHDGKPLTAADVKFTIMEVLKKVHPRGINTFRDVTDVETPDDFTAVFKLANAAPYMLAALSGYESPILPKHVFGQGDIRAHPNANQPIGTGPFKFVEWRRGELVRLDKNPDYWRKGLPYLDRIVVRFINDEATRTAALEKGEAHVAGFGAVPYNDAKKLAQLPSIEVTTKGYEMISPVVELLINTKKAPLDNQKVRQAMAYAVDRQFVIDNIWFGFGKPATGLISSNFAPSGLYTAEVTKYQVPDGIERANKLLDEAGFPRKDGGIRFEIMHDITPYGPEWQRFGEVVQQQLAKIGIKATLRYEDVATWLKRIYSDYDFALTSNFLYNLPDPVLGVHRAIHGKLIRQGTVFVNGSQWSDPRADELMDKATIEPDSEKRAEYYREVQKIAVAASPIIWVFELNFPTVINKRYKDVIASPLGIYANFATAWRE
jgi:peptide/nickel transport system substrate-binding protein